MAEGCCILSSDIDCGDYCLTAINNSSSTEMSQACGVGAEPIIGPTIGTMSVTGYIKNSPHYTCPGEAGVTINWVRKYDCTNDVTYFIFSGEGNSYIWGDVEGKASLHNEVLTHTSMNANAGNTPVTLINQTEKTEGFGMTWTGGPIVFNTSVEGGVILTGGICGIGNDLYLTNFTANFPMGDVPTATYSFVYYISNTEEGE